MRQGLPARDLLLSQANASAQAARPFDDPAASPYLEPMRHWLPLARFCCSVVVAGLAFGSAGARADDFGSSDLPIPFLPFSFQPDGSHRMGESLQPGRPSGNPGVTAPLVTPTTKPPPTPERSRAEVLDDLFHHLASAADNDEAVGVAARIQRLWLESGSDTVDLLMSRAAEAVGHGNSEAASDLLDKIVVIDPGWSEGWNKRATLRYQRDDDAGAMNDIAHVLTLEPRHYGAMTGMAMILSRHGLKKDALAMLRNAAAIFPRNDDLAKMIGTLELDVEGRPI